MDYNLFTIFLTGLISGGLTCMAVQGGLLAATIAQREQERLQKGLQQTGHSLPLFSFLITKLIAYTFFGALLGWLGSHFQLSLTAKLILDFAVIIFMLGTALSLLDVHPLFRYFIIQPPRFLTRIIRKQSKSQDVFAPAILGAFTVFIPCGTTQAMMALSIASGNALTGALILFVFVLGTSPVFFLLAYFTTKLGQTMQASFMKVAAYAIILLALYNLNNTIALTGSSFTIESATQAIICTVSFCDSDTSVLGAITTSNPTIIIQKSGYTPQSLTVKAGSKVNLHLTNKDSSNCSQSFTLPTLGLQKVIPEGQSGDIAFTAPSTPGEIPFMCSMGMYRGVIHVI